MTSWFYVSVYIVGLLFSARKFYVMGFEIDYEDSKAKKVKGGEKKWIELASQHGLVCSMAGVVWPLAWLLLGVITFLTLPTKTERDIAKRKRTEEHAQKIETEMIRLRKWHEDNNMEPPDTNTLRFMAKESVKNA